MRFAAIVFPVLLVLSSFSALAQHAVDPAQRYHRLICLVHLTGSGKRGDEIRPEFVPKAADALARDGIVAWSMQPTDDGRMAIIHVVAVNPHAFDAVLTDKRPEMRVFEIGKDKPEAIEAEMRKYKKDFSLSAFQVVAQ